MRKKKQIMKLRAHAPDKRLKEVLFSLRRYKGEAFAVKLGQDSRTPSMSYDVFWLDRHGELQQGVMGLWDCLEGVAVKAPSEEPELWIALRKKFGRPRNRHDWMDHLINGDGTWDEPREGTYL